jgi:hypothetical protein
MYPLEVGADVGLIVPAGPLVDPLRIRCGRTFSAGVPAVLCLRGGSKIGHSIIRRVAVLVIQGFR